MENVVLKLADQFASAAMDNTLWLPALTSLANATRSSRGQLIGIGSAATVPFNWINGYPESALQHFVAIDGGNPCINPRVAVSVNTPVLGLNTVEDYAFVAPTMRTDVYADFARQYEIPFGCQTKVIEDRDGMVGLAILRSESDGRTTAADRALFAAVAPYVRSAVRTQIALENAGPRLIADALETIGAAVFVCGAGGIVAAMTGPAEMLLREGRLRLIDKRLAAHAPGDAKILRNALAKHCGIAPMPMETLILGAAPGYLPLLIDICPAPRGAWRFSFLPQVLVIVRTGQRWHSQAALILEQPYHLSSAESDVALRLARGESRHRIAEERGSGLETVRAQLKSAFAKLGVSREVELVSMLGRLLQI